jgi:cobalamin biosynthesis protein CbiD
MRLPRNVLSQTFITRALPGEYGFICDCIRVHFPHHSHLLRERMSQRSNIGGKRGIGSVKVVNLGIPARILKIIKNIFSIKSNLSVCSLDILSWIERNMQSSNENMFKKLSSDRNVGISASRRRHRGVSSSYYIALSCSSKILPNRQRNELAQHS